MASDTAVDPGVSLMSLRTRPMHVVVLLAVWGLIALSPLTATARALDPPTPNTTPGYGVPTAGLTSYEDMVAELTELRDQHGVQLRQAGESHEGRGVWLAGVGHGPRTVLVVAQQHGNEPHGSEAALDYLHTLATRDSPEMRRIREEMTIWVMPRANPDGAAHNWRQNHDPECDVDIRECTPGQGIDPNRWHDPTVPTAEVPVPETAAVRDVVAEVAPELVLDLHGQLSYVDDEGAPITASVAWPVIAPEDLTPEREAAVDYAKRVSVLMAESVDSAPRGVASQYPLGDGSLVTARNAYGWEGVATVLFEQRSDGGTRDLRPRVKEAYDALMSVTRSVADGSVHQVDPVLADAIPERGLQVGPERPLLPNRCPQSRGEPGSGEVLEVEESVYDLVTDHAERIVPEGSEDYDRPTTAQACDLGTAFGLLEKGEVEQAADLVAPYGYSVLRLHDPETGRGHLVLAEDVEGSGAYPRGWGLFVHSPEATSDTTVIASYPVSATFSERLAAQLHDRDDAQNLLVAGAHRAANRADGDTYEPANPTTAAESALRRVGLEAVDRGEVSLQTLGATRDGREVALTSGTVPPTEVARSVDRGLEAEGYPTCLYADGTCEDLGSTGNLLAQDARAAGAEPLVLSPSYGIRGTFAEREELAVTLAALA
ncbi:M14 family zinc carboxypeptidase [Brachybacterium sp. AOP43-C2-M15]|uniref:M14 family zinc carboxypeptidase n=1 Tax=Brachybacterium sp. AOP43-C2-M15 TaxID=3457661 RepID=UPI004033AB77